MPILLILGQQFAHAYGEDVLLVVELVRVESKELEKKFSHRRLVLCAKLGQLLNVICEIARGPVWLDQLVR